VEEKNKPEPVWEYAWLILLFEEIGGAQATLATTTAMRVKRSTMKKM